MEEADEIFTKQSVWAYKARQESNRLAADIERAKEDMRIGKAGVHVQTSKP